MSEWQYTHEGEPIPKGRPRWEQRGWGKSKRLVPVTPQRTADAEAELASAFKAAVVGGPFPLSGPVRVALLFRTKSKTSDLDNCIKLVLDALNKIAWNDDRQVVHIRADIVRGVSDPSTDLKIIWQGEN